MNILIQATQPTGTTWTPADVVYVVTAVIAAIAVTLIPSIIALLNAAKAKGVADAQAKSIDRLSERANVQDAKINQVAMASDPAKTPPPDVR